MAKFKLLAGSHSVRDGKKVTRFKAGDIVSSDTDLVDKFGPQKFEKVGRTKATPPPEDEDPGPGPDEGNDGDGNESAEGATDATGTEGSGGEDGEGSEGTGEPEITLKPVHRGQGRWDVVKVIDGVETEEVVNDGFLKKAGAQAMAEAGYQPDEGNE